MKSYIFEVILILLSLYIKPFAALKEDKIITFINELNLRMCHPIPKLGLPALDPLEIRNFTVTLDNKYLVEHKQTLLRLDIIIPSINFNTTYSVKGAIDDFVELNGAGRAELSAFYKKGSVQNAEIHMKWRTNIFSPKLGIEDLKIRFDIGQALLNIDQLIEDPQIDNFVHEMINDLGVELLNDLWMEKNETIITVTQKEINNFIRNYTMHDFFQFVDDMANAAGSIFAGIPPDCKNM
uniref:Lipid-binding serum glycoprotein N-terminal domain-containing protein n=1 Tax=Glossina palpalis gambiensis TaxID=67801 RepID=A0A1B0AS23_9MUSC